MPVENDFAHFLRALSQKDFRVVLFVNRVVNEEANTTVRWGPAAEVSQLRQNEERLLQVKRQLAFADDVSFAQNNRDRGKKEKKEKNEKKDQEQGEQEQMQKEPEQGQGEPGQREQNQKQKQKLALAREPGWQLEKR